MSKGRRPKAHQGPQGEPEVKPRVPASEDGNGGPGDGEPIRDCWDFQLLDTTQQAAHVEEGQKVTGAVVASRVAVNSPKLLGYAPPTIAREIISASKERGGRLRGGIIAIGGPSAVSVHLCLEK